MTERGRRQSGLVDAEQRHELIVVVLTEAANAERRARREIVLESGLDVRRLFGNERRAIVERRERALRRQPDAGVGLDEFLGSGRKRPARDQGVQPQVLARKNRNAHARADQAARIEIVVARVARAERHQHLRCHRERVKAVERAHVAAAVGDVLQRGEVAAVVALRAVREADVVAMPLGRVRDVIARQHP